MLSWEIVAVVAIVGAAAFWALRNLWRAARQRRICSDCASSGGCPLAGEDAVFSLTSECRPTATANGHSADK